MVTKKDLVNDMINQDNQLDSSEADVNLDEYGIDFGSPLPEEQLNTVEVPETLPSLSAEHKIQFCDQINMLDWERNTSGSLFMHAKSILLSIISN